MDLLRARRVVDAARKHCTKVRALAEDRCAAVARRFGADARPHRWLQIVQRCERAEYELDALGAALRWDGLRLSAELTRAPRPNAAARGRATDAAAADARADAAARAAARPRKF